MNKLLVISGDGHATPPLDEIVVYLESPAREMVDELVRENWGFIEMAVKPSRPSTRILEQFDRRDLVRSGGEYGAGAAADPPRADGRRRASRPRSCIRTRRSTRRRSSSAGRRRRSLAGARAHHRWFADFVAACDHRLFGVAESGPCLDMDATLAELAWVREHAHVAVSAPGMMPSPGLPLLYDDYFEPFWAACEDMGLVVSVHAGYSGTGTAAWSTRASCARRWT